MGSTAALHFVASQEKRPFPHLVCTEKLNQHLHKMQREGDVPLAALEASFCLQNTKLSPFLHCRLLRVQKHSPHAAAKSWLCPSGFACPGRARIPVAIKSQVSFTLIRSLGKSLGSLFWLCFQKVYYSFCVHILLQLRNLGIKLSASLYLPLAVGQTLLAWCFLELNLVCF